MDNQTYLMAANAAVLAGIAGYVVFLAGKFMSIEKRIRQLEVMADDES